MVKTTLVLKLSSGHHSVKGALRVKNTGNKFEQRTIDSLKRCLEKIQFVQDITVISERELASHMRPDLVAKVKLPDGEKWIIIEFKTVGQPRIARGALNQLLRCRDILPEAYGVFAAPYISPKVIRFPMSKWRHIDFPISENSSLEGEAAAQFHCARL
jgi:hypothetical protein